MVIENFARALQLVFTFDKILTNIMHLFVNYVVHMCQ